MQLLKDYMNMNSDYVSEAEALSEIYDGCYIPHLDWMNNAKQHFTKHRYGNTPKGKYFIVQNCRNGCGSLMLVDRKKTKEFWWTHDCKIALKITKEEGQKIIANLHYNNVRLVSCKTYRG